MEVSIGQDSAGNPIVFAKGKDPVKVAKAYLTAKSIVSPSLRDLVKRKKEDKTK